MMTPGAPIAHHNALHIGGTGSSEETGSGRVANGSAPGNGSQQQDAHARSDRRRREAAAGVLAGASRAISLPFHFSTPPSPPLPFPSPSPAGTHGTARHGRLLSLICPALPCLEWSLALLVLQPALPSDPDRPPLPQRHLHARPPRLSLNPRSHAAATRSAARPPWTPAPGAAGQRPSACPTATSATPRWSSSASTERTRARRRRRRRRTRTRTSRGAAAPTPTGPSSCLPAWSPRASSSGGHCSSPSSRHTSRY